MKTDVIYEPKGRAREYAPLACNIYTGCVNNCKYCFVKKERFYNAERFNNPTVRKDIVKRFEKDAKKLAMDNREIMFCFKCDPIQPFMASILLRHLMICDDYSLKANVLTKAGSGIIPNAIFDIMRRNRENGWKMGWTINFLDEKNRLEWEPDAPNPNTRLEALKRAYLMGINTWVSVEPVVDPAAALDAISAVIPYVDAIKIGKLNHFPEIEKTIDWRKFLYDCQNLLKAHISRVLVQYKKDLLDYQNS